MNFLNERKTVFHIYQPIYHCQLSSFLLICISILYLFLSAWNSFIISCSASLVMDNSLSFGILKITLFCFCFWKPLHIEFWVVIFSFSPLKMLHFLLATVLLMRSELFLSLFPQYVMCLFPLAVFRNFFLYL